MKKYTLTAIAVAALVSGCTKKDAFVETSKTAGDKKEVAKDEIKANPAIGQTSLTKEQVSISYEGSDRANFYNVKLKWPAINVPLGITLGSISIFNSGQNKESEVVIPDVASGLTRVVTFSQVVNKELREFSVEITPPLDSYINEKQVLNENIELSEGRLFLGENAMLITLDKQLTIKAPELRAVAGSRIVNYDLASLPATKWGAIGLNGGSTKMVFDKAVGQLSVEVNGTPGGDGRWGWISHRNMPVPCYGDNGGAGGSSGNLQFVSSESADFELLKSNHPGKGGKAGGAVPRYGEGDSDYPVGLLKKDYEVTQQCQNQPVNGETGQPGKICVKLSPGGRFDCQ